MWPPRLQLSAASSFTSTWPRPWFAADLLPLFAVKFPRPGRRPITASGVNRSPETDRQRSRGIRDQRLPSENRLRAIPTPAGSIQKLSNFRSYFLKGCYAFVFQPSGTSCLYDFSAGNTAACTEHRHQISRCAGVGPEDEESL